RKVFVQRVGRTKDRCYRKGRTVSLNRIFVEVKIVHSRRGLNCMRRKPAIVCSEFKLMPPHGIANRIHEIPLLHSTGAYRLIRLHAKGVITKENEYVRSRTQPRYLRQVGGSVAGK